MCVFFDKIYKRKSAFARLKEFCGFAKENDFIEITKWTNCEGYDIDINRTRGELRIQLTYGEFEAIKKLIKAIDNETT